MTTSFFQGATDTDASYANFSAVGGNQYISRGEKQLTSMHLQSANFFDSRSEAHRGKQQ